MKYAGSWHECSGAYFSVERQGGVAAGGGGVDADDAVEAVAWQEVRPDVVAQAWIRRQTETLVEMFHEQESVELQYLWEHWWL